MGTGSNNLQFYESNDNGATYISRPVRIIDNPASAYINPGSNFGVSTLHTLYAPLFGGLFRPSIVSYASGTVSGYFQFTTAPCPQFPTPLLGFYPANGSTPGFGGGTNGYVDINQAGQASFDGEGLRPSYRACVSGLVVAGGATDIADLQVSSGKSVSLKRVELNGYAASGLMVNVQIMKRSSFDTGGSSGLMTNVPLNTKNASSPTNAYSYSGDTGIGGITGILAENYVLFQTSGSPAVPYVWRFGDNYEQSAILQSSGTPGENIGIFLAGAPAINGGLVNACFEWIDFS